LSAAADGPGAAAAARRRCWVGVVAAPADDDARAGADDVRAGADDAAAADDDDDDDDDDADDADDADALSVAYGCPLCWCTIAPLDGGR